MGFKYFDLDISYYGTSDIKIIVHLFNLVRVFKECLVHSSSINVQSLHDVQTEDTQRAHHSSMGIYLFALTNRQVFGERYV